LPGPIPSAQERAATEPHPAPVQIQMKNVNYRLARDIVIEIRRLRGRLERTNPSVPATFDDNSTFNVEIDSAEVAFTPESLSALMNSYVLAYDGAPIKHFSASIRGGRLVQKGTIHKGVDVPFELDGSLSATADGDIRFHADRIKAAHLPVKGLLHLFGEDLSKLVNSNASRGMTIAGDDIILAPRQLTPPPHLEGRVTRVAVENGRIVQYFDSGRSAAALSPPFSSAAYIYHRGGVLRFGKLTMNDADLEIVGDRTGVFDFFQKEYRRQLVAGYSKNTNDNGLVSHMFDYSHFLSTGRAHP
jgi:hypothetical protein